MSKSKRPSQRTHRAKPAKSKKGSSAACGANSPAAEATHLVVEKPVWNEQTGELSWRGGDVLRLAKHAHDERAIVREFERRGVNTLEQALLAYAARRTGYCA